MLHTFSENVAKMIDKGAVSQVVVFNLLFGFGLSQISDRHRKPMLGKIESLTEVMFKFTGFIMYLDPFGVGSLYTIDGASLVSSAICLAHSTAPIAILIGIDALMDMGRTGLNLVGNCLATVVVARW